MKKNLLLLALIAVGFISCEKNDEIGKNSSAPIEKIVNLPELEGQNTLTFQESEMAWNNLKVANNNSYYYQTQYTSYSGEGTINQIKVVNGQVTEKMYQSYTFTAPNIYKIHESFVENGNDLGLNLSGIAPLTIDELYLKCQQEYLNIDASANTKVFTTASNGQLKECGFIPNDCMDDCFMGIKITGFKWITE